MCGLLAFRCHFYVFVGTGQMINLLNSLLTIHLNHPNIYANSYNFVFLSLEWNFWMTLMKKWKYAQRCLSLPPAFCDMWCHRKKGRWHFSYCWKRKFIKYYFRRLQSFYFFFFSLKMYIFLPTECSTPVRIFEVFSSYFLS